MIEVDVGGAFTGVVAIESDQVKTVQVPMDVRTTEKGGVLRGPKEIGVEKSTMLYHASTHGANTINIRQLPKTAFLTTEGHRDIVDMGRTWSLIGGLMNPAWRRSYGEADRPLVARYLRLGLRERLTAEGGEMIQRDSEQAREKVAISRSRGVAGVAICLLNAYVNDRYEERRRGLLREEVGDIAIYISCKVSPLAMEFARGSTTVVDVFIRLIYGSYTDTLGSGLRALSFDAELNFANYAAQFVGSVMAIERPFRIVFAGLDTGTVSSPQFGGVIGAEKLPYSHTGGMSCDISLISDGTPFANTPFELEHKLIIKALFSEISSVGAGGGNLVTMTPSAALQVPQRSASADPGPAFYRISGKQPSATDVRLLMSHVRRCLRPEGGNRRLRRSRGRRVVGHQRQGLVAGSAPFTRDHGSCTVYVESGTGKIGVVLARPHHLAREGAIHALVKGVVTQAQHSVLANGVEPSVVDSAMIEGEGYSSEYSPLGWLASPEDIAWVIAFLASPAASCITRTVVDVNFRSAIG